MPKTKDSKAQKSVTNKSSAGKRTATPKAGRTGAKPSPQAERSPASAPQRSQRSGSKNVAKVPGKVAARSTGVNARSQRAAQKDCAATEAEKSQEKRGAIQRLKYILKRIIGYKKGERDEFRYNYDEGHPGYVFKEKQGKIKSFGVTHSESTFGVKNMPLEENPDRKDKRPAYIRNGVITSKKKRIGGRMRNFKLSPKDTARVKSKKRNYNKIAKQQKNKKSK